MLTMERKQADFSHDISYYAKDSRLTYGRNAFFYIIIKYFNLLQRI